MTTHESTLTTASGYTLTVDAKVRPTRAYFGLGAVLDKAAVLAACRADPEHLRAMQAGTQFQPAIDVAKDAEVWEYIVGFWGDVERYNEAHGTHLLLVTTAGDRLVLFDNPTCLLDADDDKASPGVCLVELHQSVVPDPQTLLVYLLHMGVLDQMAVPTLDFGLLVASN